MENTLFEFTGLQHMVADHNSLFSSMELTLEPAIELMENGPWSGSLGAVSSTTGSGVGLTTLPFDLSSDTSTAGRDLGDDSSSLTFSEDPESIPYTAVGTSAIVAAGALVETTTPGALRGIIIFFENDRPNSYVEKSAASVYLSLHGEPNKTYTFPAVITESPFGYRIVTKVFGKGLEKAKESLDIWETILEDHV